MNSSRHGRVIVGVSDSLSGLRALREATAEARRRRRELCVVRAYVALHNTTRSDFFGLGPGSERPWVQHGTYDVWETSREDAQRTITHAFDDAMGGPPADVYLRMVTLDGRPSPALVDFASQDNDLLVVGASRPRLRRPFRRSVGRYCTARAACPVLIIPPHEAARDLAREKWHWRALEKVVQDDADVRLKR